MTDPIINICDLITGGIEMGIITEISGESRTGKTQLCHMLAVTCQLPIDMGGGGGQCLYIYTEDNIRPERFVSIATTRYRTIANDCLANIACAHAYNTDHQTMLLVEAAELMAQSR